MSSLLLEGWFLGLATGSVCLFSCGPIYLPVLLSQRREFSGAWWALLELSLGRLVAYALFGAAAGALGSRISQEVRPWLAVLSFLLLGSYLLVHFLRGERQTGRSLPLAGGTGRPFVVGFLTGVNACPPFALALSRAFASGGVLQGIVFFIAFYLGTSLYLIPFAPLSLLSGSRIARFIARMGGIGAGIWFVYKGVRGLWTLLS
jgi:sulfite exporter TauE/SafE